MKCKLCKAEMYPIYAYPHDFPEVISFKAFYYCKRRDVDLYICPKCGSVFGKVNDDDERR